MNNTQQLKIGIVLSYLTLVLSNVIALIYTPFMLRMMGQSEYGLYSLVASVVAYLTILDFGFGNAIVRYTAKYRAENKHEELSSLFGMFLFLYIGIGMLAFCIGIGLYNNLDLFFKDSMSTEELSKAHIMVLLMIINVAVTFPLSLFPSIIIAHENFIFHKSVNLIRILLQPCIMVILLSIGYKAIGMVVLITSLNISSLLAYCWYCFYRLHIKISFSKFKPSLLKEICSYSFYVFLTIIVDRAFWSTGQFILGMLSGTKDTAIYALTVQLCNYYMAFSVAISSVFLPKVTQLIVTDRNEKKISDLFIKIGRIQFIVLAYILFGFILFGKTFLSYWAGEGYEMVYPLAIILMIPQTIPLIQNLGISILQAQNRQRFRSFLNLTVSLISIFVGYQLTKKIGIIGCAISTSAALLIGHGFILNWYYKSRIRLNILSFWKQIFRLEIPIIITVIFILFIKFALQEDNLWIVFVEAILYTILYTTLLWFWGCNAFEKKQLTIFVQNFQTKLKQKSL